MRNVFLALILLVATKAFGASYTVRFGSDNCPSTGTPCFLPNPLVINVGDTVGFALELGPDLFPSPHNVVANDGSFRCASGCDGAGGNGDPAIHMDSWRRFGVPGTINYHDEITGAAGTIIVQGGGPIAIGAGMSGAWYDPAQSGQGLLIDVLPNHLFYVSWLAYDPAGTQQVWLSGVGSYSGAGATITNVDMPTGGRWIPNFDPAKVIYNSWGTFTFTFADCNHGTVTFNSTDGYGAGSMNLTRLTQMAGLACP
jgi:hypothetical protein